MENPGMRSGHGRGGIRNGPLKLVGLAVGALIAWMIAASWPARQPGRLEPLPPDALFPLGQPAPGTTSPVPGVPPAPRAAAAGIEAPEEIADCRPLPGFPVPRAGEEISLVNQLKVVSIIRDGGLFHLPNPTRVKVLTGKPKRWRTMEGLYEVEVLDGEYRGKTGLAHPGAMERDRTTSGVTRSGVD